MALASQAALPIGPVPITLQSLAVLVVGAWLGPVWGAGAVLAWLALAAIGLPVLAGGAGNWSAMTGATFGFLLSFPLAAALAGRWRPDWSLWATLRLMLLAHVLILAIGCGWLALMLGANRALAVLWPLLPGGLGKSLTAALLLTFGAKWRASGNRGG
ncbi:biotin transporter BioY [Sandarakinorhabdus sp.]|uniref:biotin transporter BioY n=1 Tax=Sandarakinorhabdus sp. TaxID=1916663 RepID=UPI00286E61B2|nr:biotin transporter BioY [Sandarakinorhabdus sp.]